MSETAASSDAPRITSVADVIGRLPESLRSSPIFEQLARADEAAEMERLARELRSARQPEMNGLGKTFDPKSPSIAAEDAIKDRAEVVLGQSEPTVQGVALHDTNHPNGDVTTDRADAEENRSLATMTGAPGVVDDRFSSSKTVQALSVKNSENNGCTAGSVSLPERTSYLASKDNFFAAPSPARFAHEDNEHCTAPAPPSPMQEINPAGLGPAVPAADVISEAPLADVQLGYCRCDFFDNGPAISRAATKSGRSRAQYRVNAFLGPDKRNYGRFKVSFLTEARFFKRRAPVGHSQFYEKVWDRFDELRRAIRAGGLPMAIKPVVAHFKDSNNHVVPRAAAILFQMENEAPDIFLFLDGSIFEVRLDQKAKGSQKCAALKGLGYWKPEK